MNLTQSLFLHPFAPNVKRSGCFIKDKNALDIHQHNTHIGLPLRHIDYDIQITNGLASVTLQQNYFNPTEKFLQIEFSFPIHSDLCIYKFVAQFGNKRIQGIVKEKEQAKKQYRQAVKEGRQAAYAQIDPESKDNLNMKIGNIDPGQQIKITISYLQELSILQNTFYQLHVPATVSPSCMKKFSGKAIAEHQSVEKGFYTWAFKLTLISSRKLIYHGSQSHNLKLLSQNEAKTEAVLCLEKDQTPNRDFTFIFTVEDFHLPSYVLGRTDISSTVMLSFIPKFCQLSINDAILASKQNKDLQIDVSAVKGEYIFFLDRSGSMGGKCIRKAKEALILFLQSLPQNSHFNIVSFGSSYELLFKQSQKFEKQTLQYALTKIQKMSADLGGTEVLEPLKKVLLAPKIQGFPRQVFLLTDGQVQNQNNTLSMIKKSLKFTRCHSIGICNGYSKKFIEKFASNGKGKFTCIKDDENASQKIVGLLQQILTPVIDKVDLKFDDKLVESISPNPNSLPYILKNEVVNFYITFKGQLSQQTQFEFSYQDSMNKDEYKTRIKVDPESINMPFVDKMGHKKIIENMENTFLGQKQLQDCMYYVKVVDKKQEAIMHSVKHQVLSEFTAFVCVNKELVDGKYQQIEDTGQIKVDVQQDYAYYLSQKDESDQEPVRNSLMTYGSKGMHSPAFSPQNMNYRTQSFGVSSIKKSVPLQTFGMSHNKIGSSSGPSLSYSNTKSWHGMMAQTPKNLLQQSQSSDIELQCAIQLSAISYPNRVQQQQKDASRRSRSRQRKRITQNTIKMGRGGRIKYSEKSLINDSDHQPRHYLNNKPRHDSNEDQIEDSIDDDSSDNSSENYEKQSRKITLESEKIICDKNTIKHNQNAKRVLQLSDKIVQESSLSAKTKKLTTIQDVINFQNPDGSFSSQELLNRLFDESASEILEETRKKNILLSVVITYLVIKWIQTNHSQKQYQLIVKKAQSYIKHESIEMTELSFLDQLVESDDEL